MNAPTQDWLRPSALPKLALCGHYRSDAAGAAAERGTTMDRMFRGAITGQGDTAEDWQGGEDADAVLWAVDTARALAGAHPLEANEDALRVEVCGMTGTADVACFSAGWSGDLKSGQVRNYLEQQAAYALGFMLANFAEEWTVYLFFCDARELVTLRFTLESAEKIVRDVLALAKEPGLPTPNDYCGWCSKRFECAPRRERLGIVPLEGLAGLEDWPSELLRDFALRAKVVADFDEKARDVLKERLAKGEACAGVALQSKRGSRKIDAAALVGGVTVEAMAALCGQVSEAKATEAWSGEQPFPADEVVELPGSSFVRISQPKLKK